MRFWAYLISGIALGMVAHYMGYKDGYSAGYWTGVRDIGKAMSDACKLVKEYPKGLQNGDVEDE